MSQSFPNSRNHFYFSADLGGSPGSGISSSIKRGTEFMLSKRPDYYMLPENRPNQPKAEIADYVESKGFLVPRRFKTIEEAIDFFEAGGDIIFRSEQKMEYDGGSGVGESYVVSHREKDEYLKASEELKDLKGRKRSVSAQIISDGVFRRQFLIGLINGEEYSDFLLLLGKALIYENFRGYVLKALEVFKYGDIRNIMGYLSLNGEDYGGIGLKHLPGHYYRDDKFKDTELFRCYEGMSYSYWEMIRGGVTGSIVADSTILGRYHIFFSGGNIIVQDGKITQSNISDHTKDLEKFEQLKSQAKSLVDFYEGIRNLDRFDPTHCPVIEFKNIEGKNYFLQYHRARDTELAGFELNRPLEEGEKKCSFVRGVTESEGIEIDITLGFNENIGKGLVIIASGDISSMKFERISREVEVLVLDEDSFIKNVTTQHLRTTQLIKPKLSISVKNLLGFLGYNSYEGISNVKKEKGECSVRVRVISDGKKAYIKLV